MNKRGITQKILVNVLMSVVVLGLMVALFKGIYDIKEKQDEGVLNTFVADLQNDIEKINYKFGTTSEPEYFIGSKFHKICFSEYGKAVSTGITNIEVKEVIDDGTVKKNVFIFTDDKVVDYYIPGIKIENLSTTKYGCFDLVRGEVTIPMQGLGNAVLIGKPNEKKVSGDCVIKVPDLMRSDKLDPRFWKLNEKYFIFNASNSKVTSVCGPSGWEEIEFIGN